MNVPRPEYTREELIGEARAFIEQCYAELDKEVEIEGRVAAIEAEIERTGYYEHTIEELTHGARMAWRNSNRCIGRRFWDTLEVRDARDCRTPEEVHEECCDHIEYATNDGDLIPTITIFPPAEAVDDELRIWNYQLVRYAGWETESGTIGDPDEIKFTEYCESCGWGPEQTDFTVLPHVIQAGDNEPGLFEVPEEIILEVPIEHPEYEWFGDLDLQWYAIPVVSNMRLEIGGLQYTAAPFNGWYMETEIGARNFADEYRYDMVPAVARRMDLDTSQPRTLWKDEAIVALNRAVLHSFEQQGVTIVDHHTAAGQFKQFEEAEAKEGREVTGDWSWLIPPVSPASTHIFHKKYDNEIRTPNFFYQPPPYE